MDEIEKLLQKYEFDVIAFNNRNIKDIIREFEAIVGTTFNFVGVDNEPGKLGGLKDQYVYKSCYVLEFFTLLQKYHYNMRQELVDAIHHLGKLDHPNKNKETIQLLLASPVIDDIYYHGNGRFTIVSNKYGKFTFDLASYAFKGNKRVLDYIKKEPLENHCHHHALFLSKVFENYYAVTSLCRNYFYGTYYHSYTWDKGEDRIIDLCGNAVLSKEDYYSIFVPQDIAVTKNCDVERYLDVEREKTNQSRERCPILRIALYKQYLDSIGYTGEFEEGPVLKKTI